MIIGLSSLSLPVFGGLMIQGLGLLAFGLSGLIMQRALSKTRFKLS